MNPVQYILILLVRLYRCTLSPAKVFLFGPLGNCRFEPSCSQYALDALKTHGALSGSWLAAKRICRCHPYGGCGHDPVPEVKEQSRRPEIGASVGTARNAAFTRQTRDFSELLPAEASVSPGLKAASAHSK